MTMLAESPHDQPPDHLRKFQVKHLVVQLDIHNPVIVWEWTCPNCQIKGSWFSSQPEAFDDAMVHAIVCPKTQPYLVDAFQEILRCASDMSVDDPGENAYCQGIKDMAGTVQHILKQRLQYRRDASDTEHHPT